MLTSRRQDAKEKRLGHALNQAGDREVAGRMGRSPVAEKAAPADSDDAGCASQDTP